MFLVFVYIIGLWNQDCFRVLYEGCFNYLFNLVKGLLKSCRWVCGCLMEVMYGILKS